MDGAIAHFVGEIEDDDITSVCASIYKRNLLGLKCDKQIALSRVLCEVPAVDTPHRPLEGAGGLGVQSKLPVNFTSQRTVFVECPSGHVTFNFLACDPDTACWARDSVTSVSCGAPVTPLPPSMTCDNGVQSVPYTLVCDRRPDCSDRSDEDFCSFAPCDMVRQFECADKSCLMTEARCNGIFDCLDGSDERNCDRGGIRGKVPLDPSPIPPPPAVLEFDGQGSTFVTEIAANGTQANRSAVCPDTHFQCAVNDYCVPVFTRCNDVFDCPGREDEAGCDSYTCPGFYRCRGSRICLQQDDVCDNVFHCPRGDDEQFCALSCPAGCTCYGLSFFCPTALQASVYPRLRYLDAGSSGMQLTDLESNSLLVYLRLARCGVRDWAPLSLSNLRTLDLSHNNVTVVSPDVLQQLPSLRHLALAHNPLAAFVAVTSSPASFANVRSLDMSGVLLKDVDMFTIFPRLHVLNLTGCGLNRVGVGGFRPLGRLRVLDLRGCPLAFFPRDVFQGLDDLTAVYADNYKLCCPGSLPDGFNLLNCEAPTNEISSCESLLRSDVFRISLYAFATLACVGNVLSLAVRVLKRKAKVMTGFDVFVATLCISDSMMGIYLVIIGVADRVFLGTYLWEDTTWRHSTACKAAGFLSLLSNEVSAFMISLITLDRFLVLRFPFRQVRFKKSTALLASGVGLAIGLTIATVPLLPWASDWQFYSQVAICIPLPITRQDFAGHDYAFSVMIVLNFVLFVFIAAGQGFVYMSVQTQKMPSHIPMSTALNKDRRLARRLLTVAVSDFLCWFPIGMTAILASQGFRVPGQVNVAMAVFVMPLNSAINPFLYTLNIVLERRRLAREERLKQLFLSQLKSQSAHIGSSALTD